MSRRILIVDDEKNIRRTLRMVLASEGHEISEAGSAEDGLKELERVPADLVILDVNLPGLDGIGMLREIKRTDPDCMVLMISGEASVAIAVEATRMGAFDFLEKPLAKERVLLAVRNALDRRSIGREWRELKERETNRHRMVGDSGPIRRIREEIERVAPTTARVLILGESGTGKELIARAIHEASPRHAGPFVKVNCAAIPEELIESELFGAVKGAYTGADRSRDGKFLQADGGTLFLDEIGDMSLKAQAKVLRALQDGEIEKVGGSSAVRVDVRVVAATNKDLAAEVGAGRFREDLYFRLNVVPIAAAPLRTRPSDIPELARHFLEHFRVENNRAPMSFSPGIETALAEHAWPGNVRELQNVVERLAIMTRGEIIGLDDLGAAGLRAVSGRAAAPPGTAGAAGGTAEVARPADTAGTSPMAVAAAGGLVEARRAFEADCVRAALREADGNISAAARLLGIDRTNLHKKIQSLGLEAGRGGGTP